MITPGRPVKDVEIDEQTSLEKIFEELSQSGGFEAVNLSSSLDILSEMIKDEKCLKFVSFVGAVVSTGLRGIIKDMIKNNWFNVAITTCGALDHDIARHYSHYKEGSFTMDDRELAEQDIHRLGNVLVPLESYGPLIEEKMQEFLEEEYQNGVKEMSSADICKMIGKHLGSDSFLHWAFQNNVDVIVPGIMDGAVGSQIDSVTRHSKVIAVFPAPLSQVLPMLLEYQAVPFAIRQVLHLAGVVLHIDQRLSTFPLAVHTVFIPPAAHHPPVRPEELAVDRLTLNHVVL